MLKQQPYQHQRQPLHAAHEYGAFNGGNGGTGKAVQQQYEQKEPSAEALAPSASQNRRKKSAPARAAL